MGICKISEGADFLNGTKIQTLLCDSDADFANLPTGTRSVQLADGSYSGKAAPGSTARVTSTGAEMELTPGGSWVDVVTSAEVTALALASALTEALTAALTAAQRALHDEMGEVPHALSLTADANCTLAASLTARADAAKDPAVTLADGDRLYAWDVVELTATPTAGYSASVTLNGEAVELDDTNKATVRIAPTVGGIEIVCIGVEDEPSGG